MDMMFESFILYGLVTALAVYLIVLFSILFIEEYLEGE